VVGEEKLQREKKEKRKKGKAASGMAYVCC
jgi:hypothetical protein